MERDQVTFNGKVIDIISISPTSTSTALPPFETLRYILSQTSVVSFDAEWKPQEKTSQPKTSAVGLEAGGKRQKAEFPHVCILQIACLPNGNPVVFLVDLWRLQFYPDSIPMFHELLRELFESPTILKLGFNFKQDFKNISYTFQSHLKFQGFDRVDPFLDIFKLSLREEPQSTQTKLTDVCFKNLGISLSKDEQCSDWSARPLTDRQKKYAAIDAYCLIEIFNVFWAKFLTKGGLSYDFADPRLPLLEASLETIPVDDILLLIKEYGNDNIKLEESDRNPQKSKRKNKGSKQKNKGESSAQPISNKFVCATKVTGLARLLRIAGIDTEVASSWEGYESSVLEDVLKQAQEEGRVLLTLESKKTNHHWPNYYILKKNKKEDQLLEVLKKFKLEKNMDQISRCTKCNKAYKLYFPLTPKEELEAATGYSIRGWCMDCQDTYARYLYEDENGHLRLDYLWLATIGIFH